MPNIKSAKKRVLVNQKKALANRVQKSRMRTILKKAEAVINEGTENVEEALVIAQTTLDKSVSKGFMHKNQAARRKSRLIARARKENK